MGKGLLLLLILLCSWPVFSQINRPQTPLFPDFQPIAPTQAIPAPSSNYAIPTNGQVRMGANADDIYRQVNRNNMGYGTNAAQNQRTNTARIMAEMQNDPAFNPRLRNGVSNTFPLNKQEELLKFLHSEATAENPAIFAKRTASKYYDKADFAKQTKSYDQALQQIKDMLNGRKKLSLAEAYYLVENAFGASYLTRKEYYSVIEKSARFIKAWIQQNGLSLQDNEAIHLAIQKFMGEVITLSTNDKTDVKTAIKTSTHLPFFYDFEDYGGEKDFRNFFLTKCLATGSGQCSSLPAVYLVLAEAVGGKAYLTTAPQHSFIKYPDNRGIIQNYEPTSHWKISNKWYFDNLDITPTALRNRLYLDTLNTKQVIADQLFSLAFGYMKKFGAADGKFISDCIATGQQQFPYPNIQARFIESSMLARMLNAAMVHAGISRYEDIGKSEEVTRLYRALENNETVIARMGYKPMPPGQYDNLIKEQEFKGKVQDSLQLSGKKKRSLFIE
ncbi:MAG: hypothetical protein IAE95_05240 [Chitinophagaceae bacterium]|nr:hypothetical protein [Chitinophagaceae bacterium]